MHSFYIDQAIGDFVKMSESEQKPTKKSKAFSGQEKETKHEGNDNYENMPTMYD